MTNVRCEYCEILDKNTELKKEIERLKKEIEILKKEEEEEEEFSPKAICARDVGN